MIADPILHSTLSIKCEVVLGECDLHPPFVAKLDALRWLIQGKLSPSHVYSGVPD